MIITDSASLYSAREIKISDYGWLCETMEDFPINGGFSMVQCQNELTSMRRLYNTGRGIGLVVEYDSETVSITTIAKPTLEDNYAIITTQSTHPSFRQQGHGRWTSLVRGYYAFEMKEFSHLIYQIGTTNTAAGGLIAEWRSSTGQGPIDTRPARFELNTTVDEHIFTNQNWIDFLANRPNADISTFSNS